MSPTALAIALSTALLIPLSGCITVVDDACKDNGSCAHLEAKTFCDIDGVYSGTEAPNECIAPPSDNACNRIEACTDPAKPNCTDDSMGVCVECTENAHCSVDGESCNTNTGECGDFTPCTPGEAGDAECAANADGNDYCSEGGICTACIVDDHCTTAGQGTCDETSLECRACEVGGDDCDSGLCGTRDEGECVRVEDVIYVAMGGTDANGCGAVGSECATIKHAVDTEVSGMRNIIVAAAGTYDGALVFTDKSATLIANGEVIVKAGLPAEGDTVVDVAGTSEVVLDGITVEPGAAVPGTNLATCLGANASLSLIGSTVRDSQGLGVRSTCNLTIAGSTISGNDGGGISVGGGDFSIVNNFIVKNGTLSSEVGGVRMAATAGNSEVLDFNTIANNVKADAVGYAIECSGTNLIATNNILMLDPLVSGALITICNTDFSLIDSSTGANGGTHTNVVSAQASFVAPNTGVGDFHLVSGSRGVNEGDPAATLATDIDGEDRPQGGRHDIGADEAE